MEKSFRPALMDSDKGYWRPQTRADCIDGPRPCPYVGCRHHIYADVSEVGSIHAPGHRVLAEPQYKHGADEVEAWLESVSDAVAAAAETCVLDVADRGSVTLEVTGHLLGYTRERARQVEQTALRKARRAAPEELRDALIAAMDSKREGALSSASEGAGEQYGREALERGLRRLEKHRRAFRDRERAKLEARRA